jgi:hypothetical protein
LPEPGRSGGAAASPEPAGANRATASPEPGRPNGAVASPEPAGANRAAASPEPGEPDDDEPVPDRWSAPSFPRADPRLPASLQDRR